MSAEFDFDPNPTIWLASLREGLRLLIEQNPNPSPEMKKVIEERKKYVEEETTKSNRPKTNGHRPTGKI